EIDKSILKKDINIEDIQDTVYKVYQNMSESISREKLLKKEIKEINESIDLYELLSSSSVDMEQINNLERFYYTIGTFSKGNISRLKNNYENITAIVVHVGALDGNQVYVVVSPQELEVQT